MRLTKKLQIAYSLEIPGEKLKTIYQNVRSLNKNFNNILSDKWYKQADLLIFAETSCLCSDRFHIDGYKTAFRFDNKIVRKPRGIVCFIKEHLILKVLKQSFHDLKNKQYHASLDLVLLQINDHQILTGYKSPSINEDILFTELMKFNMNDSKKHSIFLGDFNCDVFKKESTFENWLNQQHYQRAIKPGISTTNFNTQIDVIFVNDNVKFYEAGVYETFFSDHKPIFIGINEIEWSVKNSQISSVHIPNDKLISTVTLPSDKISSSMGSSFIAIQVLCCKKSWVLLQWIN